MLQWVVTLGALAAFVLGVIVLAKLWRDRFPAGASALETRLKSAAAPLIFIVRGLYWFSIYAILGLIGATLNLVHLLPAAFPKPTWWLFMGVVMGVLQPAFAALWNALWKRPAEPEDWLASSRNDASSRNAL